MGANYAGDDLAHGGEPLEAGVGDEDDVSVRGRVDGGQCASRSRWQYGHQRSCLGRLGGEVLLDQALDGPEPARLAEVPALGEQDQCAVAR
jgi:hypothetical protein